MIRAFRRHPPVRWLGAGTLLFLSLSCGRARGPKIDSESHFLGGCFTSCDEGLSCLCGVCTEACVEAADCSGVAFGAVCRQLDEAECGAAAPAVCDVACTLDADCVDVSGASCRGGWCRGPDSSGVITVEPSGEQSDGMPRLGPEAGLSDPREPIALEPDEFPPPACYTKPGQPIADQLALARFQGCETIYGDLEITFAADLSALRSLRNLFGSLSLHPSSSTQRTLAGLENLELVQGDLRLSSLELPSLTSLSRLQTVGALPGQGLVIEGCFGLQNLSGLGQLSNLHNLSISGVPQLESIAELHPSHELERVLLQSLPRLASIASLALGGSIDSLTLDSTALETLDGLPASLGADGRAAFAGMRIRELTLINNGLLANIDAVGNMQSLRVLRIQGNTKLTGLPALPFVSSLDELRVSDSPQLGALTLGGLQFIKNLEIERNSSLTSIELPQLTTPVQSLIVVSNGSLAADSFRPLMLSAAKAKIGGNQGDPTGLSPCPWRKDGHCDSPPTDTLCAPNTDLADCGYVP